MKKSILLMLTVFGLNAAIAQTNTSVSSNQNGINPPPAVTTKFKSDYPNINPTWVMDGENYSAEYRDMSTKLGTSIVYDKNGNRISTNNEMGEGTYPTVIGDYYTKNYPKEVYTVWSSEDGSGNKTYYSKGKDNNVWFDKDGKYVSKKTVSNPPKETEK